MGALQRRNEESISLFSHGLSLLAYLQELACLQNGFVLEVGLHSAARVTSDRC